MNAASLALMAFVTWQLGRTAIVDFKAAGLAVTGGVLLVRYRLNSAWLILAAAAFGMLISAAGAR